MEKLLWFCRGYVKISIRGEQRERFLNLCRHGDIPIQTLRWDSSKNLTAYVSLKDFFRLRPIGRKAGIHIRVQKKRGLPFFLQRNGKRKAFFAGILLCILLIQLCSQRIWNIHIEGNQKNTTQKLLQFLETQGIAHGMAKKKINCRKTADALRKQFPEVSWVSVRIDGTRLLVSLQEGDPLSLAAETEKERPCNIVADVDGTVVRMVTRRGTPLITAGTPCKKGDILVSGRVDILNDSQEPVRYHYVPSDADIYASYSIPYYEEFPMSREKQIPTGNQKSGLSLRMGDFYVELFPSPKGSWNRVTWESPLYLTENFMLPVFLGKGTAYEYVSENQTYTKEEARALAMKKLHLFEEKLMEKGVQISENNVKINISQTVCAASGTLTVVSPIGAKEPIGVQAQPQNPERTAKDGQQYH